MITTRVHRRGCFGSLLGACVGTSLLAPAWPAARTHPRPQLLCVDRPEARAHAVSLWPDATLQTLTAHQLANAQWWHVLARQLDGRSVIAVLDERAALLWDALLTPAAHHTAHRLLRTPTAGPLHLLSQRF